MSSSDHSVFDYHPIPTTVLCASIVKFLMSYQKRNFSRIPKDILAATVVEFLEPRCRCMATLIKLNGSINLKKERKIDR